jgi:hypothetical protein
MGFMLFSEVRSFMTCTPIIRVIKPRRMRWARHVARMGAKRNAYRILVGKQEGKRPLGRPKHRCMNNIKWILERQDGMLWIGLI